jgi:hypothetical protein
MKLDALIGKNVVIDLNGPFVCMGLLEAFDDAHFHLKDADLHDVRDSDTTRENYVIQSRLTGIKRNRKRVLVVRAEVVAIARMDDVVDE